ncbi:MAG: DinB family protein [Phaeodactylibacter sp.]|uniref:DinB family protein n=1 Tax=Phaeodactylibacter sp. TaxID=1940289 RepID=UPI0032EF98E9
MAIRQIEILKQVSATVEGTFGNLSRDQLNWKPGPDRWSIAQCLDHLIRTNEGYLSQLAEISLGIKRKSLWERLPFLPAIFGKMLLKASHPEAQGKMKAPKAFEPLQSNLPAEITGHFLAHNRALIRQYEKLPQGNLASYRLTSPASKVIVLRLEDVVQLLPAHEQRHLQQALRVMQTEEFPG